MDRSHLAADVLGYRCIPAQQIAHQVMEIFAFPSMANEMEPNLLIAISDIMQAS